VGYPGERGIRGERSIRGRVVFVGELYPGRRVSEGEGYPEERDIRERGVSGREGYPGERGIWGEGYPGERERETLVRDLKGEREEGCRKTRENVVHSKGRELTVKWGERTIVEWGKEKTQKEKYRGLENEITGGN